MQHPVTIAILINLSWLFITTLTSSMPVVSFKHLLARLWFVVVFYFLGTQLFANLHNIKKFIWAYVIPLLGVIVYTMVRHAQNGWTQKTAHWVMYPFYNDHTAYAAIIALFLPVMLALSRNTYSELKNRIVAWLVFLVLLVAMMFSYTRAAWISLMIAALVYVVFILRVRIWLLFVGGVLLLILFFMFRTEVTMKLEKTKEQSSTDFGAHIKSVSNITTDASNLERINRWQSALRMFRERPFLGWGPGTYQFQYAPFQLSKEMTFISTNAGNRGNAHSEYIGPLAESGVLGMLTFILIAALMIYRGTVLYFRLNDKEAKLIVLGVLLGLITYLIHGTLNNFLDTDKASIPFWGFIAILVAIDVRTQEGSQQISK
jgi:O-antigen ligase